MDEKKRVQHINELFGDLRQFAGISETLLFQLAHPLTGPAQVKARLFACMRDVRTCPRRVEVLARILLVLARLCRRGIWRKNLDVPIKCQKCGK